MTVYYPAYMPTRQKPDSARPNERKGLLAKIHVAKKQMGLTNDEYEMILRSFKVASAADMTIRQLENVVKLMKHYGWKERIRPKPRGQNSILSPKPGQIAALQDRAVELWGQISNLSPSTASDKRFSGLVKKICGVDNLAWCRSTAKLERLLKVLGKIRDSEDM